MYKWKLREPWSLSSKSRADRGDMSNPIWCCVGLNSLHDCPQCMCSCMCSLYSECVLFLDSVLRSGTGCIRGCAPRLPLFPPPFELTFDPVIEGWWSWSLPHSGVSTEIPFHIKLLLRRRWLKCRFSLWHNKCDMWWLPIHPLDQSKETHEEETHGGARPGKQDNCFLHWPPSPEEETWDREKDLNLVDGGDGGGVEKFLIWTILKWPSSDSLEHDIQDVKTVLFPHTDRCILTMGGETFMGGERESSWSQQSGNTCFTQTHSRSQQYYF